MKYPIDGLMSISEAEVCNESSQVPALNRSSALTETGIKMINDNKKSNFPI